MVISDINIQKNNQTNILLFATAFEVFINRIVLFIRIINKSNPVFSIKNKILPVVEIVRYSNREKLDRYYRSVFSNIPPTLRYKFLRQLERSIFAAKKSSKDYQI